MNENQQMQERFGGAAVPVALGFVVGAVVGAGIALLLAPATGKETRQRLADAGERMNDAARTGLDQVAEVAGGLKRDAKAALEAGREAFGNGPKAQDPSPDLRTEVKS